MPTDQTALILGCVLGGLVGLGVIVGIVVCCWMSSRDHLPPEFDTDAADGRTASSAWRSRSDVEKTAALDRTTLIGIHALRSSSSTNSIAKS